MKVTGWRKERGRVDRYHHLLCALYYPLHNHAFHSGPHYHGTHTTGCLISQRAFEYWIKSSETEPAQPNGKCCSSRQAARRCHHFSTSQIFCMNTNFVQSLTTYVDKCCRWSEYKWWNRSRDGVRGRRFTGEAFDLSPSVWIFVRLDVDAIFMCH